MAFSPNRSTGPFGGRTPAQTVKPPVAPAAAAVQEPPVDAQTRAALRLATTLSSGEAPVGQRSSIVWALLRDLAASAYKPRVAKNVLLHLVDAVKNGFVPLDSVNAIGNALLGDLPAWNEADRASALRAFLIAITDSEHSELLCGAVIISVLRLLEGYPPVTPQTRGDLAVWLGFAFVRRKIPRELATEALRAAFTTIRMPAVATTQRAKVAWVLSTLVDSTVYPDLPTEELAAFADSSEPDIPDTIREQIKLNLNRRMLLSVGYLQGAS